jgi:hypothetical protein
MKVDVVVPARRDSVDRLLYSLSRQTRVPDTVIVVSNEVTPAATFGLNVEVVRFWSQHYAVGQMDVALRRNIGIWESEADIVVFQDDDQIAPPDMVQSGIEKIGGWPFIWGHHRYLDFEGKTWDQIMALPPAAGRSRERSVNVEHGWYSCYAGMMLSERSFLIDVGGFDMMFMGDHAGEDQNLGRRMLAKIGKQQAFISEPPFAWHPNEESGPWPGGPTNLCPDWGHERVAVWYNEVQFYRCTRCPHQVYWSGRNDADDRVVIPYEHSRVQLKKESIR